MQNMLRNLQYAIGPFDFPSHCILRHEISKRNVRDRTLDNKSEWI